MGRISSPDFASLLRYFIEMIAELGVLLVENKMEVPTTKLSSFSIELDTDGTMSRLPHEKLQ